MLKADLQSGLVSYLDQGVGPAVLLIHAFPLDHTMWQPQMAALSSKFRVIAPDTRGFGGSLPPGPWTMDQACDVLNQLLDRLDVKACSIVGLSMGGYIALPFYAKFPLRVRHLVLADTRARADNDAERAGRNELIEIVKQEGIHSLPDRMIPRLLQPSPDVSVAGLVRSIIERAHPAAVRCALAAMRDRPDASGVLDRIDSPTLVLAGEHDAITRVDECRAMAERVPGGRFIEIPYAGHLSNLENPKDFNRALIDFLPLTQD